MVILIPLTSVVPTALTSFEYRLVIRVTNLFISVSNGSCSSRPTDMNFRDTALGKAAVFVDLLLFTDSRAWGKLYKGYVNLVHCKEPVVTLEHLVALSWSEDDNGVSLNVPSSLFGWLMKCDQTVISLHFLPFVGLKCCCRWIGVAVLDTRHLSSIQYIFGPQRGSQELPQSWQLSPLWI